MNPAPERGQSVEEATAFARSMARKTQRVAVAARQNARISGVLLLGRAGCVSHHSPLASSARHNLSQQSTPHPVTRAIGSYGILQSLRAKE